MTTKSFRHPWGRVTTCRVYDHSPGAIHDEAFRFEGDWRTLACRPMHWCFSSRSDRPGFRGSQLVKWCALTRHTGAAVTLRATGPSLRLGIVAMSSPMRCWIPWLFRGSTPGKQLSSATWRMPGIEGAPPIRPQVEGPPAARNGDAKTWLRPAQGLDAFPRSDLGVERGETSP